MSEDIPEPGPVLLALGAALYLSMMTGAGVLYEVVRHVPPARSDDLEGWPEWSYDFCVRVAEFTIALLLHLRSGPEAVRRIGCPRCGARADVLFDPPGRSFTLRGGCWHMGGNFPLLVSPPGWWRQHVRPEDGWLE